VSAADELGPVAGFGPPADRPWLWAPDVAAVRLELDGTLRSCVRDGEHWVADTALVPGQRYRFEVDGQPVPDPRSRAQPEGVHGPSCWIPPGPVTAHVAAPTRSLERSVIYELHVGTFSAEGTFLGAIERLDHLLDLGVTHLELMPVAAFDGRFGWGYDGVDLFAPHPAYGTEADLHRLVSSCHERGLAVLVDVVLNHLGPAGNYLGVSGPYFTDRYRTPWGDAVNLDGEGSDGVRRFLLDAAQHWLVDLDVDGLRLDAVHALFDTSAVTLLEQLALEVDGIGRRSGRPRLVIAESDRNDPRLVAPPPAGTGLQGVWSDDLHHCLHVALTGERLGYYEDVRTGDLSRALAHGQTHEGRWSPHRRRSVGRPVTGTASERLVVSLQNHDQVGNRAGGERLHHLVGVDRSAAAAALVLLSPFSAMVFQGEEWAASTPFPYVSDHSGELGDAIRRGRRAEFAAFGWGENDVADPQDPATFAAAVLRWDELSHEPHAQVLEWYRSLVALRAQHPALGSTVLPAEHRVHHQGDVVQVERGGLTVVANLGTDGAVRSLPDGAVLLARGEQSVGDGELRLGPGAGSGVRPGVTQRAASAGLPRGARWVQTVL
jgi:maltooligosyltrehalose trehalohydrolase